MDLGAARTEQASALTRLLRNQELRLVRWDDFMHGQDLDKEVAFLTGVFPTFRGKSILLPERFPDYRSMRLVKLSTTEELS